MKRLYTIIAAMLLTVTAFAQQALWGGPQIESPVINPDGKQDWIRTVVRTEAGT